MMRRRIFGAMMLSLCLVSFPTKAVFAMEVTKPTVGVEESSPELKALYNRQIEIDQLLLEDNAKKIEELGFMVNSTGVVNDRIEIAISPYKEEYADFIYALVGKDDVKVVEMDQSILYATSVAPDQSASNTTEGEAKVYKGEAIDATNDEELAVASGISDKDDTMVIQIESVDNAETVDKSEAVDKAGEVKAVSTNEENIKTVAAVDNSAKDQKSSTPTPVIAIAVCAAFLSFAVNMIIKKRRK